MSHLETGEMYSGWGQSDLCPSRRTRHSYSREICLTIYESFSLDKYDYSKSKMTPLESVHAILFRTTNFHQIRREKRLLRFRSGHSEK